MILLLLCFFFFLLIRRPPRSTLFPTRRSSDLVAQNRLGASLAGIDTAKVSAFVFALAGGLAALSGGLLANIFNPTPDVGIRSEEHTSELQSQSNLVCRLLLEKKKKNKTTTLIR